MSLGWTTENTFQKKAGKKIEGVDSVSVFDLKSALFTAQAGSAVGVKVTGKSEKLPGPSHPHTHTHTHTHTRPRSRDPYENSNIGVSERNERDVKQAYADNPVVHSFERLQQKAAIYDNLVKHHVNLNSDEEEETNNFLIDFQRKGWTRTDEDTTSTSTGITSSVVINDNCTVGNSNSNTNESASVSTCSSVQSRDRCHELLLKRKHHLALKRTLIEDKNARRKAFQQMVMGESETGHVQISASTY